MATTGLEWARPWAWAWLLLLQLGPLLALAVHPESMLCADDNTPICGRTHGEYLLFKNECDLRKAQRENLMGEPLYDVALQNCLPGCDFDCEATRQAVCGVSAASGERKEFLNRCEMVRHGCATRSDWLLYGWGACPRAGKHQTQTPMEMQPQPLPQQPAHTVLVGQPRRRRPIPCTNVYRPVCASYAGVKSSFSNECLVNAENIRTGRNWRIVSEGLCGEDSTKMKHSRKWKPKTKAKSKAKARALAKPRAGPETERSKRSHGDSLGQMNQLDDLELAQDAVQIFAPSTFHTQFISNSGVAMEKSYSLPARAPPQPVRAPSRHIYGSSSSRGGGGSSKPCVFSNEPVCGSFNGVSRSFDSVCALMEHSQAEGNAWTVLYEGACRRCDKPCPSKYSPVCASRNGVSYTIINECYLERVRCKDPNSSWRITRRGECALPAEEVAQGLPAPSPKPQGRIPHLLYATRSPPEARPSSTTTKPRVAQRTRAPANFPLLRRLLRKPKQPAATPKDLSSRKVRKIVPNGFRATSYNHVQAASAASHYPKQKKAFAVKFPPNEWRQALTTAAPARPLERAQQLDLDTQSATEVIGQIEADTEILFMLDRTAAAEPPTTPAPSRVTSRATSQVPIRATATTTVAPFRLEDTTELVTERATEDSFTSGFSAASSERTEERSATEDFSMSGFSAVSSEALDQSTTADLERTEERSATEDFSTSGFSAAASNGVLDQSTTAELERTTAATATMAPMATTTTAPAVETTTATAAPPSEASTTQSLDYLADEPGSGKSDQTSIYGLDKNSLIMRLLRARSGKNMVL